MENALLAKVKSFRSLVSKAFPLRSNENSFTKGCSIICLKEKYVYKVTKAFPLSSIADLHNSVKPIPVYSTSLGTTCSIQL